LTFASISPTKNTFHTSQTHKNASLTQKQRRENPFSTKRNATKTQVNFKNKWSTLSLMKTKVNGLCKKKAAAVK